MLVTEILNGGSEVIDSISAEWIALCEEGASNEPFFRPEWFSAFVSNFESSVEIITVRRDGKLRAVLPLVAKRASLHGLPVRKFQAVFNLNTQRFDLIHGTDESEREEIVRSLWLAIKNRRKWDVLEMRLVKKESWIGDILKLADAEKFPAGIWPMDSAPFISLPPVGDPGRSLTEFFKGPRKHLRQQLERRSRRLKEIGEVDFVVTREYSRELLERYFELEAKGWKGRKGTAVSDDTRVSQLHHHFAKQISDRESLHIYELKLDGRTIAMSLNIRYDHKMIHWKTSYDEEFARYSPGNLLFRNLVANCIDDGSPEIDFLSPATPNKKFWSSSEREHVGFYVFRRGILGQLIWKWMFAVITPIRKFKQA